MHGHAGPDLGETSIRFAHAGGGATLGRRPPSTREQREAGEELFLAEGATRARGAGRRKVAEEADPHRTCFERDRDRVLHSSAFRRLAGKTQVFVHPADHQRTRLTHAIEVSQVASAVARTCGLNVALVEAIALAHDCGHGPGGHAAEDALSPYVPGGFDHAVWGADVALAHLNLTEEVLDGIRNHSWSRPAPATPEGELVAWADRCAYVAHDLEDAQRAGIVRESDLPLSVRKVVGDKRSSQLRAFVSGLVSCISRTGRIGMEEELAAVLGQMRDFNYRRVYLRPESVAQGRAVIALLRALVEYFAAEPGRIPGAREMDPGGEAALSAAVAYVAGMTDRFAFDAALRLLDWPAEELPRGIDSPGR